MNTLVEHSFKKSEPKPVLTTFNNELLFTKKTNIDTFFVCIYCKGNRKTNSMSADIHISGRHVNPNISKLISTQITQNQRK